MSTSSSFPSSSLSDIDSTTTTPTQVSSSSSMSSIIIPTTTESPIQSSTSTSIISSTTTTDDMSSSSSSSSSSSPSSSSTTSILPTTTTPVPPSTTGNQPPSTPTVTPPPNSSQPPSSQPPSNDPTSITSTPQPTSQPSSDPPDNQPTLLDPTTPSPPQSTNDNDPDPTSLTQLPSSTPPPTDIPTSSLIDSVPLDTILSTSITDNILPSSTFSSTVFLTATDSQGSTTLTAPALITSLATSTRPDGSVTTITQVIANPTLIGNNASSRTSAFFKNTGAVAGVFVLVGLAVLSIILWIIFAVRRRRRHQRLDHDTAVSATLAAAGFHRTPLVDDDDDPGANSTPSRYSPALSNPFMAQRSSSGLAISNRASAAYLVDHDNDYVVPGTAEYNPYAEYASTPTRADGYVPVPAPTAAPIFPFPYRDRTSGNFDSQGSGSDHGHARTNSIEPLIGGASNVQLPLSRSSPLTSLPPAYANEDVPFGIEIARAMGAPEASAASSIYSQQTDTGPDARLDPGLRQRLNGQEVVADDGASLFRDEEDYSRPVLGVRNMPDAASQTSTRL